MWFRSSRGEPTCISQFPFNFCCFALQAFDFSLILNELLNILSFIDEHFVNRAGCKQLQNLRI